MQRLQLLPTATGSGGREACPAHAPRTGAAARAANCMFELWLARLPDSLPNCASQHLLVVLVLLDISRAQHRQAPFLSRTRLRLSAASLRTPQTLCFLRCDTIHE